MLTLPCLTVLYVPTQHQYYTRCVAAVLSAGQWPGDGPPLVLAVAVPPGGATEPAGGDTVPLRTARLFSHRSFSSSASSTIEFRSALRFTCVDVVGGGAARWPCVDPGDPADQERRACRSPPVARRRLPGGDSRNRSSSEAGSSTSVSSSAGSMSGSSPLWRGLGRDGRRWADDGVSATASSCSKAAYNNDRRVNYSCIPIGPWQHRQWIFSINNKNIIQSIKYKEISKVECRLSYVDFAPTEYTTMFNVVFHIVIDKNLSEFEDNPPSCQTSAGFL